MQSTSPSGSVFRWEQKPLVLAAYGWLGSLSAFLSALAIFLIPADPNENSFLGLSPERSGLIGVVLIAGALMAGFAVKAHRDYRWAERVWQLLLGNEEVARGVRWGSVLILFVGCIASFLPAYRFGDFQDYFVRLRPLIIWLTFLSALTFVISWVEKYGSAWGSANEQSRTQAATLKIAGITLAVFALIWGWIAWTGFGITVVEDYWFGAGVPILGLQILTALLAGTITFFAERRLLRFLPRADILAFFLIWGLAALLWIREPLPSSYFAPGPYPPAHEYYPYSDAAFFDLGSQFALIGQGFYNGIFVGRALYMEFLLVLHALVGQDYAQVIAWQAGIYAVFPAILYLLGKESHSRSFGVTLGVLAILRGVNGIAASTMINLANQKQMLSDFPTAIFVAWFACAVVKWLKAPGRNYAYALWAGGIVGLGSMLRTNALLLVFFALFLAFIVYKQWRHKIIVSSLIGFALLASIVPWGMQSGGSFLNVYLNGIRSIIDQRYHLTPPAPTPTPTPQDANGFDTGSLYSVATKGFESHKLSSRPFTGEEFSNPSKQDDPDSRSIPVFVSTHFLHNAITSVFILPMSPSFHDLRHTVRDIGPFWDDNWVGGFDAGVVVFLILNLLLIALGIGVAWESQQLTGLVPLGAFIFYSLADSLARTSGGRYIVPIDWIVLFYFSLGLLQLILWGLSSFGFRGSFTAQTDEDRRNHASWTWRPLKRAPWIILTFLVIGASLPLSERFFPRRYPDQSRAEILSVLEQQGYLQEMGFDRGDIDAAFAQWPALDVTVGRALYPRFYPRDKGEPKASFPYMVQDFPRIAFMLIGPHGLNSVVLPEGRVPYFPNAADAIILGCRAGSHIDAFAVVVIAEQTVIHMREPASPIQCPLQQPVCDENNTCQ